ncbi:unnamed protein product [Nippostrongylus brasiliensis]|uniref:Innexin n=1 Tax=Nippostrongylus brasiliensis TaxID=27835 RepID=A0A0N4YG15_NIPBR|nr:unnamed protein product [Nippostrongylus brasiliensis]
MKYLALDYWLSLLFHIEFFFRPVELIADEMKSRRAHYRCRVFVSFRDDLSVDNSSVSGFFFGVAIVRDSQMDTDVMAPFWWRAKRHPKSIRGSPRSRSSEDNGCCRDSPEGMNFIAKHFFEYQSFVNMPHKAVQLHKTPPSQAGADPSVGWAPKNMHKAGKNQPAPAARANRINRDPRPNGTKHGRAAKHEHREWGDRHGDIKYVLMNMVDSG